MVEGYGSLTVPRASAGARVTKRTFDVAMASIVLLAWAPIVALVALAIVVESRGPVFYRARRVGYRGRELRMLKFRKMSPNAGSDALTTYDDARLTRVGAILAATRIDELPQFWHVLRGEMSLVGPRPEDPRLAAHRPEDFREILLVRPGISGLSQLAFADERRILRTEDPVADYLERILPQKCALDRLYVRRATLTMDLRIVVWTVIAVLLRRPVAVNRSTGATSLRRRPLAVAAALESPLAVHEQTPPPEPAAAAPP